MEPGVLAVIKEHCKQCRKVTYPSQYYRSAFTELSRAVSSFNSTDFCRAITTLSKSVSFSEGEIRFTKKVQLQRERLGRHLAQHHAWPHWAQDSACRPGLTCPANVVQQTAKGKQSRPLHFLLCCRYRKRNM